MYDARAVANFFIDRAAEVGRPLTIMTLLKVMYFAHAWYLAKFNSPLIGQPFEAWKYGPVNRVVYDQYKNSKNNPITKKAVSFVISKNGFVETPYDFDQDTFKFLREMFDYYSSFHAFKLSDLTHEQGSPWDVIWGESQKRVVPGMIIPNDLIRSWFTEREALYWGSRRRERPT